TPFLNINRKVSYATWLMSTDMGGIHGSVLNSFIGKVPASSNLGYFLNSVAKIGQAHGLFCYSEPSLLKVSEKKQYSLKFSADYYYLFRFVKQHYKTQWLFILFLNLLIFQGKAKLMPLIYSFWFKKRTILPISIADIKVQSTRVVVKSGTV